MKTLDGAPVFVTADDRFAYEFTSFAASGLPVEVLAIGAHGVMNDVTQSQLDLVKKDAAQWWHAYMSQRGKSAEDDIRGVLGAWCADEYRLGDKAACDAELASALEEGLPEGAGDLAAEREVHRVPAPGARQVGLPIVLSVALTPV